MGLCGVAVMWVTPVGQAHSARLGRRSGRRSFPVFRFDQRHQSNSAIGRHVNVESFRAGIAEPEKLHA